MLCLSNSSQPPTKLTARLQSCTASKCLRPSWCIFHHLSTPPQLAPPNGAQWASSQKRKREREKFVDNGHPSSASSCIPAQCQCNGAKNRSIRHPPQRKPSLLSAKKKRANFPSDCTGRLLTSEAPQSWRVQDGRSRVTPPRRHRDLNGRAARPRPLAAFSSRCRHPVCCLAAQRVAPVATTATGRSNRRVLLCCCSPQGKRVQDLNTLSLTSGCRLLLVPATIS